MFTALVPWWGRALVLAGVFLAGATINGWRWEAKLSEQEAEQAKFVAELHHNALLAERAAANTRDQAAQAIAALDQRHTEELTHANAENERLRADIDAGRRRLRIHATCPGLPNPEATAGAAGLDHATGAELDPAARQDYHALRASITRTEAQLRALQAYVVALHDKN